MDECENAVKDHPYADIMKRLDDVSAEDAPRILGLTDSILQSKCETAEELEQSISNLERTLHCTAQTASDTFVVDLLACRSQEKVIECADYLDQTGLLTPVLSLLDTLLSFINSCNLEVDQGAKDPRALPRTVVEEVQFQIIGFIMPQKAIFQSFLFVAQLSNISLLGIIVMYIVGTQEIDILKGDQLFFLFLKSIMHSTLSD